MARQLSQAADIAPERDTVLHSWCIRTDWNAPTIVGGEAARLYTADRRTILDMSSLAECSSLGHQHPRVVAAILAQARKLCFVTSAWGAEPRAACTVAANARRAPRTARVRPERRCFLRRARQPAALAPPLVIGERELTEALELLDRLLGGLGASISGEQAS